MFEIETPFSIKGILLKPELSGRLQVDETLIQTLSAVMGFDGESRRLIRCGLGGSLYTTAPTVQAITNTTGNGGNDDITFSDTPTSEVMILANAGNTGDVWINIGAAAAVDTGWPLDAGDVVILSINNLRDLQMRIITSGDKVIIIRTV